MFGQTNIRPVKNGLKLSLPQPTLVMPMAATFSLYDVVPFPEPKAPAMTHATPSMPIPGVK